MSETGLGPSSHLSLLSLVWSLLPFLRDSSDSLAFGGEPLSMAHSGHLVLQLFGSFFNKFLKGPSTNPR